MAGTKVIMKDVAQKAGVSITTVSFVLNKNTQVAIPEETRERVSRTIRELGYVRNAAGRHLASGKSHMLAIVLPAAEHLRVDAFIPQILSSLNEICHKNGFGLLVHAIEDPTRPDAYADLVSANSIDGLFILNPRVDERQINALIDAEFPLVIGPGWKHDKACGIGFSNRGAACKAVEYLIGLGHRRIACVNYGPAKFLTAASRYLGYKTALEKAAILLDEDLVVWADFSHESGYRAAMELLDRCKNPTAIFVGNDTVAIGVLAALRERGFAVPGDLSVVGMDDIPAARFLYPPLTTVSVDAMEYGRRAGEMLISLVKGVRPEPARVYLETKLVVRDSSAPPS
ncbi:MAG: LacI family DNA-binding transcriptional regulator [Spirochaetes bacterium]|nr:LacI family DNA-binding transcriptional regulator [Spirochaetota bacterium]